MSGTNAPAIRYIRQFIYKKTGSFKNQSFFINTHHPMNCGD